MDIDNEKKIIQVPLVELSLDEYIIAANGVSEEKWKLLEETFSVLLRLSVADIHILRVLTDLLAFCKASPETKEILARAAMSYHFQVDNHLILVMNNIANPEKTSGYLPSDIIGYTLSHKGKDNIHITYCMVHSEFRRKNYATTMIKSLCEPKRNCIEKVTINAVPDVETLKFFTRLGFVPTRNNFTTLFRETLYHKPETLTTDPVLAPLRGSNGTFGLIHYSTCCHTCKDSAKPTKRCNNCLTLSYCSNGCQKQDWPLHRQHCVPFTL